MGKIADCGLTIADCKNCGLRIDDCGIEKILVYRCMGLGSIIFMCRWMRGRVQRWTGTAACLPMR